MPLAIRMTCSATISAPPTMPQAPRAEHQERRAQLDDVIERDAHRVRPVRQRVKVRRQRAGHRLRLEVEVEAGEIAPAGIAAQLDEPRAPHDPHRQPAQEPDDGARRRPARERPRVEERTEEDAEESGLDELELPAEAVEGLADVADRDLQRAEDRQHERVGVPGEHRRSERDADQPAARSAPSLAPSQNSDGSSQNPAPREPASAATWAR